MAASRRSSLDARTAVCDECDSKMRRNLKDERTLDDAELRFRAALARRGLKWSAGRRRILDALARMVGHFTADELAEELRHAGASASRATVFRALPLFVEAGLVQPLILRGEVRRYETAFAKHHHDHMVCTSCGRVIEFEFEAFEMLQREVAARHGFALQGHVHELFGSCDRCTSDATSRTPPDPQGAA